MKKSRSPIRRLIYDLHDDIIAIWELGEQYEKDYPDKIETLIEATNTRIVAFIEKQKKEYFKAGCKWERETGNVKC